MIEAELRQISIGILTWRRPGTLRHALASYRRAGILDAVGEVILFANAADRREIALAERYGLRHAASARNLGIGAGFQSLARLATRDYFLFLENDWPCIEPTSRALDRLAQGVRLLAGSQADAVRYRHRHRYGHPLYSRKANEGHELDGDGTHLLDAIHWRQAPEVDFPGLITRRRIGGEDWFFADSAHASYTNNPSLYRTGLARDAIGPLGDVPGIGSEAVVQDWWRRQGLVVAQGEGLFMHRDPGKEWRRAGRMLARLVTTG